VHVDTRWGTPNAAEIRRQAAEIAAPAPEARFVCAGRRVKKAGNDERKGHAAELTNC
jgi:hypothetical protein